MDRYQGNGSGIVLVKRGRGEEERTRQEMATARTGWDRCSCWRCRAYSPKVVVEPVQPRGTVREAASQQRVGRVTYQWAEPRCSRCSVSHLVMGTEQNPRRVCN